MLVCWFVVLVVYGCVYVSVCGGVVVWWCGGVVVWWCWFVGLWWCGVWMYLCVVLWWCGVVGLLVSGGVGWKGSPTRSTVEKGRRIIRQFHETYLFLVGLILISLPNIF